MKSKEYTVITCWAIALSKHCMSRQGNSHVTGQAVGRVGGIGAESAPNVRKYVESAAVVAAVLVLVGG